MSDRRFRLLHIIDSLDPATGGPSESIRVLLTSGTENCHSEVLSLDSPDAPFLSDLPFPVYALGGSGGPLGYSPHLHPWLVQNRDRFDGFVVHGLWRYISFASWRALHGRRPYFVFTHGMLDPYFKRAFPRKHLQKWLYWLAAEYRVLRDADRVLFTTEEENRLAAQSFWLYRWQAAVVPFGASPPPGNEFELRQAFADAHPELAQKRFVLFLGRIHRKKGCDMLIHSFIRHASLDPDLHLVMAGPDQQGWQPELQALVAEAGLQSWVHWPGMLHGNVKWGSLYTSEVFILPSHQENFGIAVAEALACGRAVLLSDKVNIAPELEIQGCGLMSQDTQNGTDSLLTRWIGLSAQNRRAMEAQALVSYQTRYDLRRTTDAIVDLFRSLAVSRKA